MGNGEANLKGWGMTAWWPALPRQCCPHCMYTHEPEPGSSRATSIVQKAYHPQAREPEGPSRI
jgi:hypothetical protein